MFCAFDLDGCIDANPREFQSIMSALMAAGHTVAVVTGTKAVGAATADDFHDKAIYLNSLGCGQCYDTLVVIGHSGADVAQLKAQWLTDNNVDVLFDNDVGNIKAAVAAGIPLCLCPWASKVKP